MSDATTDAEAVDAETEEVAEVVEAAPAFENPVSIKLNGEDVVVDGDKMLIDAVEDAGEYIPRFCYHPRMTPVGMCRMCIVECDTGRGPALTPTCMIKASPDMVVDTESEVTKAAQDGVLELLLINHPLDCPVCDKGGECPLQDQTMAYGPGESRFVEEKRHYEKPIAISETVYLDRERCILCDRCTASPMRSLATRSSTSWIAATPPRSTPSRTSRSVRTSAATPCRSARSVP